MEAVKVIYDRKGQTLTVYWKEPGKNQVCEETGEGVILIKDEKSGEVIGFERLYFQPLGEHETFTVKTVDLNS